LYSWFLPFCTLFGTRYDTQKRANNQRANISGDDGRCTNPNFVETLHYSDAAHAWIGGDFGTALSLNGPASAVEDQRTAARNFSPAQNYPNPFSDRTFIPITSSDRNISVSTPVSLNVFDMMGREVLDLSDEYRAAISVGVPLAIPASLLPVQGVYYSRAVIGAESGGRMMVRR
jgi:hypothetical protein